MSHVELYLLETDGKRIAQLTATKLEAKQLTLIALIQSLAGHVNDDDDKTRTQSLAYLADVLEATSPRFLTFQQRTLLTDFVISRVQHDPKSIGPSLRALTVLESRGKWTTETTQKILTTYTTIIRSNSLKSFKLQSERFQVLQLIDLILAHYRTDFNAMAEDPAFVSDFVAYFDGEKDPRNLMMVFSILQVPMTEWDLKGHVQHLFDAVFDYFPITFRPPPNDPYGLTAQDLKARLRACIASTSAFAPYAFPALLDKLDSSSLNTKRDVLHALAACVRNYYPQTVSSYSVTLWETLKSELAVVQEVDIINDILSILSLTAASLASGPSGALDIYLKPVIRDCNAHVDDAPTKQSQLAGQILASIMQASWVVAEIVIENTLPGLFALFEGSSSVRRRGLIEILNDELEAAKKLSATWLIKDDQGTIINDRSLSNALQPFSDTIFQALSRAVEAPDAEVSLHLAALKGLTALVSLPRVLNPESIDRLVDIATDITLSDRADQGITKLLIETARHYPDTISSRAIPKFYARLPDSPKGDSYIKPLETLAQLSVEPQIAHVIIQRLRSKVTAALHQAASPSYIEALITALLYVFCYGSPSHDQGVVRVSYYWDLGKGLLEQSLLLGDQATDLMARLCLIIIRPQSMHTQNQIYHSLSTEIPSLTKNSIASFYMHAALRRHVFDRATTLQTLRQLTTLALETTNTYTLRHITLLINKFVDSQTLQESGLDANQLLSHENPAAVRVAFAVTKGLLLRGDGEAMAYMTALSHRLSDPVHGQAIAHLYATLLCPDTVLVKQNHCIIHGLHKQRVYTQVLSETRHGLSEQEQKTNHLTALSGLFRWLPYSIIQPTLADIVLLLIQSLDVDSALVKTSTLTVLESVLLYDAQHVSEHASSIIKRLAQTAAWSDQPDQRSRALRCLNLMPLQMKRETLLPYRSSLVKDLSKSLDDRKREVRVEAVKCRSSWMALDAGDEMD